MCAWSTKRVSALVGWILVAVSAVQAQDQAPGAKADIKTETVTLSVGESTFKAYLARPAGDEPAPGILIIHEWWGLNDWIKQQTERFAEKGYVALAIDLYHGEVATDGEHAHELMRGLSDERALGDMKFAFEFLSGQKYTKGHKTAVIGWCMGGGFALKLAVEEPRLAGTIVCYGRPILDADKLKRIKGPMLGIWGATDRGIDVDAFKAALKKADNAATHHVYPGAGHAFMNPNNTGGYKPDAAEKAWAEIDAFLAKSLR